jgi:hypothetical protein
MNEHTAFKLNYLQISYLSSQLGRKTVLFQSVNSEFQMHFAAVTTSMIPLFKVLTN